MPRMDSAIKKYAAQRADDAIKNVPEYSIGSFNRSEIRTIEYVKFILYQEPTMDADDMRDLAQLLEYAIEHMEWGIT